MFYYSPKFELSLLDYGIDVPLLDSRSLNVFNHVKKSFFRHLYEPERDLQVTKELLLSAHTQSYVDELYQSPETAILRAFELIDGDGGLNRYNPKKAIRPLDHFKFTAFEHVRGTMAAVRCGLKTGFAYCIGGGLHHAMSFGGRGFCLVNDIVISLRWAQKKQGLQRAWVIDVDAHKGDGTVELTYQDPSIITLSIHMAKGWPLEDEPNQIDPWFFPSDIDIPILKGEESVYLKRLSRGLEQLKSICPSPEIALIVQGGDPYEKDELLSSQHLKLSKSQMLDRDILVFDFLKKNKIPQVYVMGGGYGAFAHEPYIGFLKEIF